MSFSIPKSPIARFLAFFGILYLSWYLLYELLIHPWGKLDEIVINNSTLLTAMLLDAMGFVSFTSHDDTIRTVGIDGTHGLWVGDPCNGIALFSLFAFFIIAYPGPWKKKLWFIPVGILSIHLINVLRITALCVIVLKKPEYLEFNHTYTFTILVTGYVFMLWMVWGRFFSKSR